MSKWNPINTRLSKIGGKYVEKNVEAENKKAVAGPIPMVFVIRPKRDRNDLVWKEYKNLET